MPFKVGFHILVLWAMLMSRTGWYAFALLMVLVATGLYMLGYRWYDHDATGVGAVVIILLMASVLVKETGGRRK